MYQNSVLHTIGSTVDHITYSYFFMSGQEMYADWKKFYAASRATWKRWFWASISFYYLLNIPISSEKIQTASYNWDSESVWQHAMGWTLQGSNRCWGEFFWTLSDWPQSFLPLSREESGWSVALTTHNLLAPGSSMGRAKPLPFLYQVEIKIKCLGNLRECWKYCNWCWIYEFGNALQA